MRKINNDLVSNLGLGTNRGRGGEGGRGGWRKGHGPLGFLILPPSCIFGIKKIKVLDINLNNDPLRFLLKTCDAFI